MLLDQQINERITKNVRIKKTQEINGKNNKDINYLYFTKLYYASKIWTLTQKPKSRLLTSIERRFLKRAEEKMRRDKIIN